MTDERRPTEVSLTRLAKGRYEARNANGAIVEFGVTGDAFTPGELFLAALAGCAAVDVDVMTSRRAEPSAFVVTGSGVKATEGGNHFEDLTVTFRLAFPDGPAGDEARARIPSAVRASHERDCTVSRTVEAASPVGFRVIE